MIMLLTMMSTRRYTNSVPLSTRPSVRLSHGYASYQTFHYLQYCPQF